MTDSKTPHGVDGPTALPGLQILGEDTAVGVCADGVCAYPGSPPDDAATTKAD